LKNPQAIFGQCLFSLPDSRLRNLARAHLLSKLLLFVRDSKFMSPIVIGLQYYRAPKFAAEHASSICGAINARAAIFFKHLRLASHFRSFRKRLDS